MSERVPVLVRGCSDKEKADDRLPSVDWIEAPGAHYNSSGTGSKRGDAALTLIFVSGTTFLLFLRQQNELKLQRRQTC